jgi:hypothetical protein
VLLRIERADGGLQRVDHPLGSYSFRAVDRLSEKLLGDGQCRRGSDDPLTGTSQRDPLTREMSETDLGAEILQDPMDVATDPIATILCVARLVPPGTR